MSYNSKIAAVLGNGPSRKFYDPSKAYDFRMGCNIPWTDVDATIILDQNIIELWAKDKTLIKVPAYFSSKAWTAADEFRLRAHLYSNDLFLGLIGKDPDESSGNVAAKKLVEEGYAEIDIYGCDAYWTEQSRYNTESYTREFITDPDMANNSSKWKSLWDNFIANHPEVKFNFIKE